jgi:hypothetical protein
VRNTSLDWLRQFGRIGADTAGLFNLFYWSPESIADVARVARYAKEIADRESFEVPGLTSHVMAAEAFARDFGSVGEMPRVIVTLKQHREAITRWMNAALVDRDPGAVARYRQIQGFFLASEFRRRLLGVSAQQSTVIMLLRAQSERLYEPGRTDRAAFLARITVDEVAAILEQPTLERAGQIAHAMDGKRRVNR